MKNVSEAEERRRRIISLIWGGFSGAQIARLEGVSRQYVSQVAESASLFLKPKCPKGYLSVKDGAIFFGYSEARIWRLVRSGDLASIRVRNHIFIKRQNWRRCFCCGELRPKGSRKYCLECAKNAQKKAQARANWRIFYHKRGWQIPERLRKLEANEAILVG